MLPQPSLAVNVRVCDRLQPVLETDPSLCVTVVLPQASVAVAVPSAPFIEPADGLQPKAALLPPVVRVGPVTSAVHVAVRALVEVLPQPSTAVHILVCDLLHPVLTTAPSDEVNVRVTQLSEADALPSAPLISLAHG